MCSLITTLNASSKRGLIPLKEFELMEQHGLSRVQAKNYLDLEWQALNGFHKSINNILQRAENVTSFINIEDENGDTLLHRVFMQNPDNIEIIKTLIDVGADINAQNNNGDTILHIAMRNYNDSPTDEHFNMLRFILDPEATNADIDLFNKNHESPRTLNQPIIRVIVAEQHQIKHDQALQAYDAYKRSKERVNDEY